MTRNHLLLVVIIATLLAGPLSAQVRDAPLPSPERPTLIISPSHPATGSLVRLTIRRANRLGDSLVSVTGTMAGEPLHFAVADAGSLRSFGPVPLEASDSVIARAELHYVSGACDTLRTVLRYPHRPQESLGGRPRQARRLRVSRVYTSRPDSLTELRVARENLEARDVGRRAHDTPQLWTEPFLRPRRSRITSAFGAGRLFNGRVGSSHGGVDFSGHPGEPVQAANRGVVVLVSSYFLAGNVVYLDHGAGVVTGYFHLTMATVVEGDTVQRGQEIGLVGATGRVTGPHLHWSARYGEHTVNPMNLIELTGGSVAAPRRKRATAAKRAR